MASYSPHEYARSLIHLKYAELDRLAQELDTGRYPGELDWFFRLRLRELLPQDVGWDNWTPVIPKYSPQPATRRLPTLWEHLRES